MVKENKQQKSRFPRPSQLTSSLHSFSSKLFLAAAVWFSSLKRYDHNLRRHRFCSLISHINLTKLEDDDQIVIPYPPPLKTLVLWVKNSIILCVFCLFKGTRQLPEDTKRPSCADSQRCGLRSKFTTRIFGVEMAVPHQCWRGPLSVGPIQRTAWA